MAGGENETGARVVAPGEGKSLAGGFAILKLLGEETGGSFALVEHVLAPKALAAPIHTHRHEHEASFVLEGEITVQIGDRLVRATPGTLVVKPRGIPHSFWNSGEAPARLLELIWPAGFERYFEELDAMASAGLPPDPERLTALAARYGLELDLASIPTLAERHGLRLGG